jgi:hypothetical protein
MIVVVVDQKGGVVKDAKVSVVNNATGAAREAVSGSDGSATIPALSLTGTYTVGVSKAGFGNEELKDIRLRSGESATLTVKLRVGAEKAEVTVYGTAEGVSADPQIGRRLDSAQIDETPILGRKVTTIRRAGRRRARGIASSTKHTARPARVHAAPPQPHSTARITMKRGAAKR